MPDDPAILGYAAGIIDGEGSFSIKRASGGRPYHSMAIRVSTCDRVLADWLVYHFGGYISVTPASVDRSTLFKWTLPTRASRLFIEAIRPYLVIKGPQAEVGLSFCDTNLREVGLSSFSITPGVMEIRGALREQMLALNGRHRAARQHLAA